MKWLLDVHVNATPIPKPLIVVSEKLKQQIDQCLKKIIIVRPWSVRMQEIQYMMLKTLICVRSCMLIDVPLRE